jgi:hypothetical protein
MIAFIDIYKFLEWSFLAMLPLLLLLRRPSVVAEKVAK